MTDTTFTDQVTCIEADWLNDVNTKTYKEVGIDDNATSTAVTIDASGNVGIGTTSPGSELEVDGDVTRTGEGWNSCSLLNSWVNYGGLYAAAQYRKMPDGRIDVKGLIKNGTLNTGVTTLPASYRPSEYRIFAGLEAGNAAVQLLVRSDGVITTVGATTNTWLSIECSFYP